MSEIKIPILDLSTEVELLWDELNAAFEAVVRSGRFIMGPQVREFEEAVAAMLGVKHVIGLNSGTDALVLALRALGVGAGDEVITTPFSFFATAEAIHHMGARPVFVDIDPQTFNIDVAQVAAAITPRTRAIIPVHLFGQMADMDELMHLARQRGIAVVEDAAQAFGATYRGRYAGTMGVAGAFSAYPTKNLGAYGDAGFLATNDDGIAEAVSMLRKHGSRRKYYNEAVGYNSRLDTLQAAILQVKLPHIPAWNALRREAAARYDELLANMPQVVTPFAAPEREHIYHQYTIRLKGVDRDRVKALLAEAGIGTMIYYPVPMHQLPMYAGQDWHLPQAEQAAREVLSLPMWPHITPEQQQQVAAALRQAIAAAE